VKLVKVFKSLIKLPKSMQRNELNFPIENILLHTFRHLYYLFQSFGHTNL